MRERGRNTALLRDERRGACLWSVFVESGESAASDAAAASNEQEWGVEYMIVFDKRTTVEIAEIQKASSAWTLAVEGAWPAPTLSSDRTPTSTAPPLLSGALST